MTNQYSAYTGVDHTADPGRNYGVYCEPWSPSPTLTLTPHSIVQGAWITNTTYAALSMLNGDGFAKKFGGDSGNDADWFLLSISGTNSAQSNRVDFYLADYRFDRQYTRLHRGRLDLGRPDGARRREGTHIRSQFLGQGSIAA